MKYICPDCASALKDFFCSHCERKFFEHDGIWELLPKRVGSFKRDEARFHDQATQAAQDLHQLTTYRNQHFHDFFSLPIVTLSKDAKVLEIGSGSGFDAGNILEKNATLRFVLSDISLGALREAKKNLSTKKINQHASYIVCDAEHLPFADNQFDAAFMVAAWHHMLKPEIALKEMQRVVKLEGYIIMAVEPNIVFSEMNMIFRPLLKNFIRPALGNQESVADEKMKGFSRRRLKGLFEKEHISIVTIEPMWFFAGFLHYGLEFLFRFGRLTKRIRLPFWFEKKIVGLDRLFFRIRWFQSFCFHWIIIGKK